MKCLRCGKSLWITLGTLILVVILLQLAERLWLVQTEAALRKGELKEEGLVGGFLTPKAGVLYHIDSIEMDCFETFLGLSNDDGDKALIIALLGWTGREDALEILGPLSRQEMRPGKDAQLAKVSIEMGIPFPRQDFASEYYRQYAMPAAERSNSENVPLAEAAMEIAEECRLKWKRE